MDGTRRQFDRLTPQAVLDSVGQGVYVTDTERRIVYWNDMAEQITGWSGADIVGRCCHDNILCHVDKDGHPLCGAEYCPLHRSIQSGTSCDVPGVMFARHRTGARIPLQVTVAPIRDRHGSVIGGVETFRDLRGEQMDLMRARAIQNLALQQDLPEDPRLRCRVRYTPHDMVGGDFYAIARLDADRYGLLIGDVAGHGVSAALYTMHLSSLWEAHRALLSDPPAFAELLNDHLCRLIREPGPFAACLCGLLDLKTHTLRLISAGIPGPLLIDAGGRWRNLGRSGFPFGLLPDTRFHDHVVKVGRGDCLLFYTDGVLEIETASGTLLGQSSFERTLASLGYPRQPVDLEDIEEALLQRSNRIRFDDDFTLVELRLR